MPKPENMPVVIVEWVDSMSHTGWDSQEAHTRLLEQPRALHHYSVGFLFKETDEYVAVVQSMGEVVENVSNTLAIPRVAVVNVWKVTDGPAD